MLLSFIFCLFLASESMAQIAPALTPAAAMPVKKEENNKIATPSTFKILGSGIYLGTYTHYYKDIQTDDHGGTNSFDLYPVLTGSAKFHLYDQFSFRPEMGLGYPQKAENSRIKKYLFLFRGDLAYMWRFLTFRLGSSLFVTHMRGEGGTVQLNNGTGYDNFYIPETSSTAINYTYDLGIEATFLERYSVRTQLFYFSLFEKESRQVSYMLLAGAHF